MQPNRIFAAFVIVFLVAVAALSGSTPAFGMTFAPDPAAADAIAADGDCSLREAVDSATNNASANAASISDCGQGTTGTDTINLAKGATYNLAFQPGGQLLVGNATSGDLVLQCNPAQNCSATAGNFAKIVGPNTAQQRVLFNDDGGELTMELVEISGGKSPVGSGLLNEGTATLNDVQFKANYADPVVGAGAPIHNNGTLTVNGGFIRDNFNTPSGLGGGIYNNGQMTLDGVTIENNEASSGGGVANLGSATIRNSTIQYNDAVGTAGDGGGISNTGTLDIINSSVTSNTAPNDHGGGIYSTLQLTMTRTHVDDNAGGDAGGLFIDGNATISLGTINGNTSSSQGGGVYVFGASAVVSIDAIQIANNEAFSGGGGIYSNGHLTVQRTFVEGNNTDTSTGGINSNGNLVLSKTLVRNNESLTGVGGVNATGTLDMTQTGIQDNMGGGLVTAGPYAIVSASTISGNIGGSAAIRSTGSLDMSNSTVSNNTGGTSAGAISAVADVLLTNVTIADNDGSAADGINITGGTTTMRNTIISNPPSSVNCGNTKPLSEGHNLESENDCLLTGPGDIPNGNAVLGPLAATAWTYGPPALQTRALLGGSQAVDAGDNAVCSNPPVISKDQRGQSRPKDGNGDGNAVCDIGAFEAPPGTNPSPTPSPTPTPGPSVTATPTPTATPSGGATPTDSGTPTEAATPTDTGNPTETATPTDTGSPSETATPTDTGSPGPTDSGTATPTATVTPSPSPTAAPTPAPPLRGDVNCDGVVDVEDVEPFLKYLGEVGAALVSPCQYLIGEEIYVAVVWDDTDCDLDADTVDLLNILLFSASLNFPVVSGCSGVGLPLPLP